MVVMGSGGTLGWSHHVVPAESQLEPEPGAGSEAPGGEVLEMKLIQHPSSVSCLA